MTEEETATAGRRVPLPPRRPSEIRKLAWAGCTIYVSVGYGPDGLEPREIFYSGGYRSGSDMEALVSDLCIALSVMLQHGGVTAAGLAKSMGETFDVRTGDPMPASVLGVLLEELQRPPERAARMAGSGEGAGPEPAEENGISGATEADIPASGEAPRTDTPGPGGAARHEPEDDARDGAESGGGQA